MDNYLTVAEIAERFKLNLQTVRNWIDQGQLSAVRLGSRRVRVLQSELDRFIGESSPAQIPTEEDARKTFEQALEDVRATAAGGAEEGTALRRLARASTALARVMSR